METQTSKPKRSMNEIMADAFRCTNCDWTGPSSERIWAHYSGSGLSLRGFICPQCFKRTTERVEPPPEPEEKGYLGTIEWKGWKVDLVQSDEDD